MSSESPQTDVLPGVIAFLPHAFKEETPYVGGATFVVKDTPGAEADVLCVRVGEVSQEERLVVTQEKGEEHAHAEDAPRVRVTMSSKTLVAILCGKADPMLSMMCGQILVSDLAGLLRFSAAFTFSQQSFAEFAASHSLPSAPPPTSQPPTPHTHKHGKLFIRKTHQPSRLILAT